MVGTELGAWKRRRGKARRRHGGGERSVDEDGVVKLRRAHATYVEWDVRVVGRVDLIDPRPEVGPVWVVSRDRVEDAAKVKAEKIRAERRLKENLQTLLRTQSSWIDPKSGELLTRL